MTDPAKSARRARHNAIRAQVADEENEAIETEVAENATALDISLHLRISQSLDAELRRQAAAEHIPTSALVSTATHPIGAQARLQQRHAR